MTIMRALSMRQPYAAMILQGKKREKYRSWAMRLTGERFYIYAARMPGSAEGFATLGWCAGDLHSGHWSGVARRS